MYKVQVHSRIFHFQRFPKLLIALIEALQKTQESSLSNPLQLPQHNQEHLHCQYYIEAQTCLIQRHRLAGKDCLIAQTHYIREDLPYIEARNFLIQRHGLSLYRGTDFPYIDTDEYYRGTDVYYIEAQIFLIQRDILSLYRGKDLPYRETQTFLIQRH